MASAVVEKPPLKLLYIDVATDEPVVIVAEAFLPDVRVNKSPADKVAL